MAGRLNRRFAEKWPTLKKNTLRVDRSISRAFSSSSLLSWNHSNQKKNELYQQLESQRLSWHKEQQQLVRGQQRRPERGTSFDASLDAGLVVYSERRKVVYITNDSVGVIDGPRAGQQVPSLSKKKEALHYEFSDHFSVKQSYFKNGG